MFYLGPGFYLVMMWMVPVHLVIPGPRSHHYYHLFLQIYGQLCLYRMSKYKLIPHNINTIGFRSDPFKCCCCVRDLHPIYLSREQHGTDHILLPFRLDHLCFWSACIFSKNGLNHSC